MEAGAGEARLGESGWDQAEWQRWQEELVLVRLGRYRQWDLQRDWVWRMREQSSILS